MMNTDFWLSSHPVFFPEYFSYHTVLCGTHRVSVSTAMRKENSFTKEETSLDN